MTKAHDYSVAICWVIRVTVFDGRRRGRRDHWRNSTLAASLARAVSGSEGRGRERLFESGIAVAIGERRIVPLERCSEVGSTVRPFLGHEVPGLGHLARRPHGRFSMGLVGLWGGRG